MDRPGHRAERFNHRPAGHTRRAAAILPTRRPTWEWPVIPVLALGTGFGIIGLLVIVLIVVLILRLL
jgi:hypothetical protein